MPTLNLQPDPQLLVPRGIYVTETIEITEALGQTNGRTWPSVTSCGYNPTFGITEFTVETYLLHGLSGVSPSAIAVHFRHFLRAEQTYLRRRDAEGPNSQGRGSIRGLLETRRKPPQSRSFDILNFQ